MRKIAPLVVNFERKEYIRATRGWDACLGLLTGLTEKAREVLLGAV